VAWLESQYHLFFKTVIHIDVQKGIIGERVVNGQDILLSRGHSTNTVHVISVPIPTTVQKYGSGNSISN
jgi:hypothetical protein